MLTTWGKGVREQWTAVAVEQAKAKTKLQSLHEANNIAVALAIPPPPTTRAAVAKPAAEPSPARNLSESARR